jgi:DNA polymerase III delta subunit
VQELPEDLAPSEEVVATWSQWWVAYNKNPAPKQVIWLCGPELVLIDEVVETTRRRINPEPWDYSSYFVGEGSERDMWASVNGFPAGATPRLVLIRDAEKLEHPEYIEEFLANRAKNPNTYLVFVSNDNEAARVPQTPEEKKSRTLGALLPHIAAINTKGRVIECKPFTGATAKHAVAWVMAKAPVRQNVAAHLLNRANGNLRLVRDVCAKLSVFDETLTFSMVNALLSEQPRDTFVDAMLALDKKTALLALEQLAPSDYSRTLGQLDSYLELAGRVHDMTLEHKTQSEIVRDLGNRGFLAKDIAAVSKYYDRKRLHNIRTFLAEADVALNQGTTVGLMEALVVFY